VSKENWFSARGIKLVFFDADDTVWPTIPLFRKYMGECYDYLGGLREVQDRGGRELLKLRVTKINDQCFETMGVSPKRWEMVMDQVAGEFNLMPAVRNEACGILGQIYTTPVRLFDGVEETLNWLQDRSILTGVITHANYKWTIKKFEWSRLYKLVPWEWVHVVDENGHKTAVDWKRGIVDKFGLNPKQVASAGDSPRTDVRPSWEAGVRQAFLVDGGVGASGGWSLHQIEIDPRTKLIRRVADLIDYRG